MNGISPEQVRAEIQKFWDIMCGKSAPHTSLEELYSPSALLVTGKARKPETSNLALARRARQTDKSSVAELGEVEVQIEEPGVAIATYTYKFHHNRVVENGSVQKRHTLFGRATQIFQLDQNGRLRIVHEHLSSATSPETGNGGTSST